jgi:CubicO group peptidase (beta-lactamase class C family)
VSSRNPSPAARIVCALCLLLVAGAACGASPPAMPDTYRRLIETGVRNGAYASVAVGLVDADAEQTWFFGKGDPVDGDSAFEIGAVSDVLTGLLLAQAALDGKVRLDAPLQELLPGAFGADNARIGEAPVAALATQQTGLPLTPANLFPADAADPYANYRDRDLLAFLRNGTPAAGAPAYSALNAGLLGLLLGRAYASDYAHALAEKVLKPLGLSHTTLDDTAALVAGHANGLPVAHWHYAALAGAAGLRSTLKDLLGLVRANLRPEASPLRGALLLARHPRATAAGAAIGLGWNIEDVDSDQQTWPVVWRASETGGFSAFLGFRTDRQQGLVLLANSAVELAPLGLAWLAGHEVPPPPPAPYHPDPAQLARYPGLYRMLDGSEVTIRDRSTGLFVQRRGDPAWPLAPLADGVFTASGGSIGITFVRNIDQISGLLLRSNGVFVSGERLSARAPRLPRPAIALDAAVLAGYAGDYAVQADVLLRITVKDDGLVAQYTGASAVAMHAYAADHFADDDGVNTLAFVRDDQHRIVRVTIDLAGGERTATPLDWHAP